MKFTKLSTLAGASLLSLGLAVVPVVKPSMAQDTGFPGTDTVEETEIDTEDDTDWGWLGLLGLLGLAGLAGRKRRDERVSYPETERTTTGYPR